VAGNGKVVAVSGGDGFIYLSGLKRSLFKFVGDVGSGDFRYQLVKENDG
jgi:hypothetical protein